MFFRLRVWPQKATRKAILSPREAKIRGAKNPAFLTTIDDASDKDVDEDALATLRANESSLLTQMLAVSPEELRLAVSPEELRVHNVRIDLPRNARRAGLLREVSVDNVLRCTTRRELDRRFILD